jgi:ribosomal protein S18 acetylase RimI-like enzyme
MIHIRLFQKKEFDFFMDMQYESIYILNEKPPKHILLNAPNIKKYSENWGRNGDRALVALDDEKPIGAVWYRLFEATNQGYGFVDNETPELGMAVLTGFRQRGLGRKLLEKIIEQAGFDGFKTLSLSVNPENEAAVRLYEKLGFKYHSLVESSWTMKLIINPF